MLFAVKYRVHHFSFLTKYDNFQTTKSQFKVSELLNFM